MRSKKFCAACGTVMPAGFENIPFCASCQKDCVLDFTVHCPACDGALVEARPQMYPEVVLSCGHILRPQNGFWRIHRGVQLARRKPQPSIKSKVQREPRKEHIQQALF